jgi:hypothetical protein
MSGANGAERGEGSARVTNRLVRFVVGAVLAVVAGLVAIEFAGGGHSPVRPTVDAAPAPAVANGSEQARPTALTDEAVRPREIDPASLPTGSTGPARLLGAAPAAGPARQAAAAPAGSNPRCGDDAVAAEDGHGTWVISHAGRRVEVRYRNTTTRHLPARGGLIEFTVRGAPPERHEVDPYRADLCPGEELSWTVLLDHDPVGDGRLVEER